MIRSIIDNYLFKHAQHGYRHRSATGNHPQSFSCWREAKRLQATMRVASHQIKCCDINAVFRIHFHWDPPWYSCYSRRHIWRRLVQHLRLRLQSTSRRGCQSLLSAIWHQRNTVNVTQQVLRITWDLPAEHSFHLSCNAQFSVNAALNTVLQSASP